MRRGKVTRTVEGINEEIQKAQGSQVVGVLLIIVAVILFGISTHIYYKPGTQTAFKLKNEGIKTTGAIHPDSWIRKSRGVTSYSIKYSFDTGEKVIFGQQTIGAAPTSEKVDVYYLKNDTRISAIDISEYVLHYTFNLYWILPLGLFLFCAGALKFIVNRKKVGNLTLELEGMPNSAENTH